jgi:hypothetical protein
VAINLNMIAKIKELLHSEMIQTSLKLVLQSLSDRSSSENNGNPAEIAGLEKITDQIIDISNKLNQ